MTKSEYAEKLKEPHWKFKRLEILERDKFTCRSCGDKHNKFHVHHKYYIDGLDPWEYENDALITLCEACHELHHLIENLKSKDFPPLFLPRFKSIPTVVMEQDILADDYYDVPVSGKRLPFAMRRQYKFLLKLMELARHKNTVSFHTVIGLAKSKLSDMCLRMNFILKTEHGEFGVGDVTNLKPEQYF